MKTMRTMIQRGKVVGSFHPSVDETSPSHRGSTRSSENWCWFCTWVSRLISNIVLCHSLETSIPMSPMKAWSSVKDWRRDPAVTVSSPSGPNSRLMQEVNHSWEDLCGWGYSHTQAIRSMLEYSYSEHSIGQDCDSSSRTRATSLCRAIDCPVHRSEWLHRQVFELTKHRKSQASARRRKKMH